MSAAEATIQHMDDLVLGKLSRSERIRRGDRGILAEGLGQYRPRLLRTVLFRLDPVIGGGLRPEDVLQEAFLNGQQRHRHVEGDTEAELFVWLRMIVLQTIADIPRRHLSAQKRDAGRETSLRAKANWNPVGGSLAS